MKKFNLLLLLSIVIVSTHYVHITAAPISANQWNVLEIQAYIDRLVIYEFTLSSDTVINNIVYTKVMQRATLTADAPTYAAAIRQEDDKVFVCYDGKEYLLYDFGAKAGDEILIWGGVDHPTTLCKNIVKDVQVADDGKRILNTEIVDRTDVPEAAQLRETAQWIEGVGSTHGLLYTGVTYTGGSFHYLQCAYTNGAQVYKRTGDTFAEYGCEYNSDHTRMENTSAAPQAVKYLQNGQLMLQLGEQVYDVFGRPVRR